MLHISRKPYSKRALLSIFFTLVAGVLMTSCSKEEEELPQQDQPLGDAYITDSIHYMGMTAYNFVYPSVDPAGHPIMLSGAITMSDGVQRGVPAPGMVLYNHFTVYRADQCPSKGDLDIQKMMAPSGLIIVSPDHYGFGVTEHHHQAYCIPSVNAQSSVDALLAARQLLTQMGFSWDDYLFNGGYSQGGQTTIGVVKLITERYPDIHLTYSFAGAGPYDIPETYRQFVNSTISGMPSTVISVLLSYNEFMNLGASYDELFVEPVLSHIDDWFYSKRFTREEIDNKVGSLSFFQYIHPGMIDTTTALAQRFMEAFQRENLCQGWTPRPDEHIMLFHSALDITVPSANSENLYRFLVANGVTDVTLDIDNYGAGASSPAHEASALYFAMGVRQKICEILGIAPWPIF